MFVIKPVDGFCHGEVYGDGIVGGALAFVGEADAANVASAVDLEGALAKVAHLVRGTVASGSGQHRHKQ